MRRFTATTTSTLLAVALLLSLSACDAIGGKPNPGRAKGIDDPSERAEVCSELREEISAWEREKVQDLDDDFLMGRKGLFEAGRESKKVNEEAAAMRSELSGYCTGTTEQRDNLLPTPTRRR